MSTRNEEHRLLFRTALAVLLLTAVSGLAFAAGIAWAAPRVVYPKKSKIDLDAISLEGDLKNPGEFYFQYRPEEKMDSLIKRRKNFHKEMLRDAVLIK